MDLVISIILEVASLFIIPTLLLSIRKKPFKNNSNNMYALEHDNRYRLFIIIFCLILGGCTLIHAIYFTEYNTEKNIFLVSGVLVLVLGLWAEYFFRFHRTLILYTGLLEQGRKGNKKQINWHDISSVVFKYNTVYVYSQQGITIKIYNTQIGAQKVFDFLKDHVNEEKWLSAYQQFQKNNA